MSVRERLEDARILWAAGRKEGAFLLILCAADATAQKRYPGQKVGERFKRYILDEMGTVTGGPKYDVKLPFKGQNTPLEDIMYYHLRCSLVHDAEPSDAIVFTEPIECDGTTYNVMPLRDPFGFPINFAWNLFKAVWDSLENDDICGRTIRDDPTKITHISAVVDALQQLSRKQKDDYSDSTALMVMGASSGGVGDILLA